MAPAELVVKVRYPFGHGDDHVYFGHSYPLCLSFLDSFHPTNNVRPIGHGKGYGKQTCA
jgi:hypothetical protein